MFASRKKFFKKNCEPAEIIKQFDCDSYSEYTYVRGAGAPRQTVRVYGHSVENFMLAISAEGDTDD